MCDVHAGVTADDRDIAVMLIKSGKPVILCVNKIDSVGALPMEYYEFYELGFEGDPIALSSLHGTGTGDLLDRILALSPADDTPVEEDDSIKVAVIGKPNAGKSSLVNRILGVGPGFEPLFSVFRRFCLPAGPQAAILIAESTDVKGRRTACMQR